MPNWFYTDADGQKQGPINDQQLKTLVSQNTITPETQLETEAGHKGKAGQIPGLFAAAPSPFVQPAPAAPPASQLFCTNCGNSISEHAVACMSCGAAPVGHRKFCRHCGVALNPEQIICIKCGAGISTVGASRSFGGGGTAGTSGKTSWTKNKLAAGLLGILLGGCGAQKYYMGSWGWGLIFTVALFFTMGFSGIVTGIIGLIEGIMILMMSEEDFAAKYPPETESPFRW